MFSIECRCCLPHLATINLNSQIFAVLIFVTITSGMLNNKSYVACEYVTMVLECSLILRLQCHRYVSRYGPLDTKGLIRRNFAYWLITEVEHLVS